VAIAGALSSDLCRYLLACPRWMIVASFVEQAFHHQSFEHLNSLVDESVPNKF
jgi:hypothetical protein